MSRWVVCAEPDCPELHQGSGRCPDCRAAADKRRGTPKERGYDTPGHKQFRGAVLARDPICVLCLVAVATDADHYPVSRRELVAAGLNPNDPSRGRGLCGPCHKRETAEHQPGGWAAR